ncbi:hypothetical protein [Sphingosinithalassobacter portus]|uniref:hypothetical protein n=1 Tax=Stakelama portus TaxID=2676234 RepID=UPI001EFEE199|nr:hypothetical protein [Sphingosinithalassobacter portus]
MTSYRWSSLGAKMNVLDRVRRLVERLSPEPACAECLAERLDLSDDESAEPYLYELAGCQGFEVRIDACALCGKARKVIGKGAAKAA